MGMCSFCVVYRTEWHFVWLRSRDSTHKPDRCGEGGLGRQPEGPEALGDNPQPGEIYQHNSDCDHAFGNLLWHVWGAVFCGCVKAIHRSVRCLCRRGVGLCGFVGLSGYSVI